MITEKGRVVYERIEHPFSYKDVLRIVTKIEASRISPPTWDEMGNVHNTLIEIYLDYRTGLISIPADERHIVAMRTVSIAMYFANQILDLIPGYEGVNIQMVWPRG